LKEFKSKSCGIGCWMMILTRANNVFFIRSLTSTARRFLDPSIAALWPDDVVLTNQSSVDYTCVTLSNDAEAETPSSHQIKRSSFANPTLRYLHPMHCCK
jgi:hypothetical protein